MNDMRDTRSHNGIALVRSIALPGVMRQKDPIKMFADLWKEIDIGRVMGEMVAMPFDAIPGTLKRVGYHLPEVPVREERELMLRIRRLELQ
jgi:hypothetical protein